MQTHSEEFNLNITTPAWEQPLPIECWLEPKANGETRLLLAVQYPVKEKVNLALHDSSGNNVGWLVLAPYAELRNRAVLEVVEVRPAGCPAPGLPNAWSGSLGIIRRPDPERHYRVNGWGALQEVHSESPAGE
ncbi:hypothetical protein LQD23_16355 [Chromobacterium violaceum]|uniref:hypothetical protein n=1 Tax=Chromobacterium violaceum TaxID=536 RepID=UPI001E28DC6F|nr:hypothetical protein [Chromobacterium violaceum]MCD0493854.1 hypothetical protein [Chromobacterium violaceum]